MVIVRKFFFLYRDVFSDKCVRLVGRYNSVRVIFDNVFMILV